MEPSERRSTLILSAMAVLFAIPGIFVATQMASRKPIPESHIVHIELQPHQPPNPMTPAQDAREHQSQIFEVIR
jgi:hypothetical protein